MLQRYRRIALRFIKCICSECKGAQLRMHVRVLKNNGSENLMSTAATTPTFTSVLYEKKGAIAYVTLNRPKVLNALNKSILADLKAAFEYARDASAVDGVIFTGAGDS